MGESIEEIKLEFNSSAFTLQNQIDQLKLDLKKGKAMENLLKSTPNRSTPTTRLNASDQKFLFASPTRTLKVASMSPSSNSILKDVFEKTSPSPSSLLISNQNTTSSPTVPRSPKSPSNSLSRNTQDPPSQSIEYFVQILIHERTLRNAHGRREAIEAIYRSLPHIKYTPNRITQLIDSLVTNLEMYLQQEGTSNIQLNECYLLIFFQILSIYMPSILSNTFFVWKCSSF